MKRRGCSAPYWDFYFGFGVIISVFLLMQGVVLWQLASLARTGAVELRPIIATFLVAFLINAILAWTYFFAIPALMAVAIAACLAPAWLYAGDNGQANGPSPKP